MIDALRTRRLAARRPPPAARARRGARSAAPRARARAVDGRSRRARRLRRKAPEPHDRPHQHDRSRRRRSRPASTSTRARCRPRSCRPSPNRPTRAYEKLETRDRVRAAIQSLPWRERKVIGLYYYGEVTMKQIGAEIGVNESRVSQLHARAIRRLREALGEMGPQQVAEMRAALVAFATEKPTMAKAARARSRRSSAADGAPTPASCCAYKPRAAQASPRAARRRRSLAARELAGREQVGSRRARMTRRATQRQHRLARVRSRSPSRNGFASQRQPLSSRNCLGVGAGDVAGDEDDAPRRAPGARRSSAR